MKKEIVHKCELCRRKVADKTNSHIVPSFIICRNASSDGSGKRNHELVYSIGKTVQIYTGNEVPLVVLERNFDNLSDERIDEELKQAPSNDGVETEEERKVTKDIFDKAYSNLVNKASVLYFNNEVTMIGRLWNELIKRHYVMPSISPSYSFIQRCLEITHDDKKKVGERYTNQNFAISFGAALSEIYGIDVSNE